MPCRDSVATSLVFGQLDDLPGQAAQAPQAFAAIPQAAIGLLTAPRDGPGTRVAELVNSWARRHDSGQGDSWGAAAVESADKASLLAPLATLLAAAADAEGVLLRAACKPPALVASSCTAAGVPVAAPSAVVVNKAPAPRAMAQIFSFPENTVIILELRNGEVILVDPFFRDAFLQQPSTESYSQLLEQLPRAFVGSTSQLRQLVALLVDQSRIAYLSHGLSCPPWRRFDAMLARWLPKHFTDTRILSPPAAAGGATPAGTHQQPQHERSYGSLPPADACNSDCSGSSAASDCTALCRFASDVSCCTATSSATAANNAACHRSDSIMTVASEFGSPAAAAGAPWCLAAGGSATSSGVRRTASGMRVIHGFHLAAEDADAAPAGSDATSAASGADSPRALGTDSAETQMPDAADEATDEAACSSRPLCLADTLLPPWSLQPPVRAASAGLAAALSQQLRPASRGPSCAAVAASNRSSHSGNSQGVATGPDPAAPPCQAAGGANAAAQPSPWTGFEPPADERPDAWVTFADVSAPGPDAGQPAQPDLPRSSSDSGRWAGDGTQQQQQHRQQQKQQASLVRRLPLLPDSAKRSCLQPRVSRDYSTICVVKLGAAAAGAAAGAGAALQTGPANAPALPGQSPAPTAAALSGLRVRSWCVGCN